MSSRINQKSHINRLTANNEFRYPWHSTEIGEVEFTSTFNTAYYKGLTFKKIKGSGRHGGNYYCVEQNDEYRISKY